MEKTPKPTRRRVKKAIENPKESHQNDNSISQQNLDYSQPKMVNEFTRYLNPMRVILSLSIIIFIITSSYCFYYEIKILPNLNVFMTTSVLRRQLLEKTRLISDLEKELAKHDKKISGNSYLHYG